MFALYCGIVTLIVLGGFSCIYEYRTRIDVEARQTPPGKLIQLREHKLHMVKKGTGGPTVVFEAGLGGAGHMTWCLVQSALAEHVTTISYDRAGYFWSERGFNPKTGAAMAEELYCMLKAAGVSKPYILVGHSMAGFSLRSFVSQYPETVAGVVLVDVSHPEQDERLPPEVLGKNLPNWLAFLALNLGLKRITQMMFERKRYLSNPLLQLKEICSKQLIHKWIPTALEEAGRFSALAADAAGIATFGDKPLVVLTGTHPARRDYLKDPAIIRDANKVWLELQEELLSLSSNSTHVLVPQAGHSIQEDHPQAVVNAVLDLLDMQELNRP